MVRWRQFLGKQKWLNDSGGGNVEAISQGAPDRTSGEGPSGGTIRSLIPARLDRLGWSRFHTRLVMALGVAWVLDGLEITIAGNSTSLISSPSSLHLSSSGVS